MKCASYIIQVLGKFDYCECKFIINNHSYNSRLSSIALYKYIEKMGGKPKLLLVAPNSLVKYFDGDEKKVITGNMWMIEEIFLPTPAS